MTHSCRSYYNPHPKIRYTYNNNYLNAPVTAAQFKTLGRNSKILCHGFSFAPACFLCFVALSILIYFGLCCFGRTTFALKKNPVSVVE